MVGKTHSIIKIDDRQLISLIETAQDWLGFIAPGLSAELAEAISERWKALGVERVKIILDVNPEVIRLGYGSMEALELLQETASRLGTAMYHQPGVRIGVLAVDRCTVLFSPNPLLFESGLAQEFHPNAVCLDHVPMSIVREIGWGEEKDQEQTVGLQAVTPSQVAGVKQDLEENPPMEFDRARFVRAFNSQFEFAEVQVRGCSISRRRASIPNELMAFFGDDATRAGLRSSFRIISQDSDLSGKRIQQRRMELIDRWLTPLPGYGSIVLRKNKTALLKAVEELKDEIQAFQGQLEERLQAEIDKNRQTLQDSLLPSLLQNPPTRWVSQIGTEPTHEDIEALLKYELDQAFGSADDLLEEMEVHILFKGVTYEMLNDPKFVKTVRKAMPTIRFKQEEDETPQAIQEPLF